MKLVAHRGASAHAPENTLAAIRLAHEHMADGVEFDVRMTADGIPVVLHDEDLLRTCGDKRLCSQTTRRDLLDLDAGSWVDPSFSGERVPLLAEVLDLVPSDLLTLIELKEGPDTVEPILDIVRSSPRASAENFYMSFNWETCVEIRKRDPESKVLGLVPSPGSISHPLMELADRAVEHGVIGLGLSDQWLETFERNPILHNQVFKESRPLLLSVWTVDNAGRARAWRRLGARYLTTNDPMRMRAEI